MMMCRVSCLVCESVCAVAAAPIDRHRVSVSMPWRGIVWRMRGGARVARTNLEVPSSSTRDVEREFCLLQLYTLGVTVRSTSVGVDVVELLLPARGSHAVLDIVHLRLLHPPRAFCKSVVVVLHPGWPQRRQPAMGNFSCWQR